MTVLLKQDEIYYRINNQTNSLEYSLDHMNWFFKCNEENVMETLGDLTKYCKDLFQLHRILDKKN